MLLKLKKAIKPLVEPLLQLVYSKECPVCGKKVKEFLPLPEYYMVESKKYGFPYSADEAETMNYKAYSCPNCGASDRERLFALYINKYLDRTKKYRLLDIAPAQPLRSFLKRKINIVYRCADLMDKDVDDTGVDIMDMGYSDKSFDIFICSHVLEHVTDDQKAMRELYRILDDGGAGIAMVPIILSIEKIDEDPSITDVAERWKRFGQDDHVRLYPKKIFTDRLKESGFTVKEITQRDFEKDSFIINGISPKSVLYIVSK